MDLDAADAFGVFGGFEVEVELGATFEDDAAVGFVEDDAAEEREDIGAYGAVGAAASGELRRGVHEEDGQLLHLGVTDDAERDDDRLQVKEAADAVGGGRDCSERVFAIGVGDVRLPNEAGVKHDGSVAAGVQVEQRVVLAMGAGGQFDGDGYGVAAGGQIEDFPAAGVAEAVTRIEGDEAVGKVDFHDELAQDRKAEDAVEMVDVEQLQVVEVDERHEVGDEDGSETSVEVLGGCDADFAAAVADAALPGEQDGVDAKLLRGGEVEDVDAGAGVKEEDHAGMAVDGEVEKDVVLGVFEGHGEAVLEVRITVEEDRRPGIGRGCRARGYGEEDEADEDGKREQDAGEQRVIEAMRVRGHGTPPRWIPPGKWLAWMGRCGIVDK